MARIIFKARTWESAEQSMKALECWVRYYYNAEARRVNSGRLGDRFIIVAALEWEIWERIKYNVFHELPYGFDTMEGPNGVLITEGA